MNPKNKYPPKSIFDYINENPVHQNNQPNERSESKLPLGNATQSKLPMRGSEAAADRHPERPTRRLSLLTPRPTMNDSATLLLKPTTNRSNFMGSPTSLQNAAPEPLNEPPHSTNQPCCTSNVVNGVHDEQQRQFTLDKLNDNTILKYRKPPDSTIDDPYEERTNEFKERTTRDSLSMPTPSTLTEKRSRKLTDAKGKKLRNEPNNNSTDFLHENPAKELAKDLTKLIYLRNVNIINSFFPTKRSKKSDLDLECANLKEESEKIYSGTHPPPEQINTIHLKLILHECKCAHRLGALGGSNPKSHYHEPLKCQLGNVRYEFYDWLDKLCA